MTRLRHHLREQRWLALWLVGLALAMRIAVPAGYMPMFSGKTVAVALCSGYGPMQMAMPGTVSHPDKPGEHDKSAAPCGFSGLATPSLGGVDPIVLVLAIAFIIATAVITVPPRRVVPATYLRPPLRGPPITA